ncbi:right-handed parallel beta-helix repeat-containing protein [Pedobacter cryoconitis]|uniref:Pectate lyase superfamily protein domain-containing protein n=1 Tax=Pedobacter cryoconitis TaxID=188932 RepID=A0A7X0MJA7_9SPHI|nr:right-handed parallel beta-helix repeat-containing protein [Pedobacter cryoconitis]MBB6501272.1 hypothetical protein [Pedobacter cryoconitis]
MTDFAPLQTTTIKGLRDINNPITTDQFYITDQNYKGIWYYDSADTTSADNTGTILVSLDGKRFKRAHGNEVLVTWFGALGDGINDDTVAIQNAINYAAGKFSVRIPKGTFMIKAHYEFYDPSASGFLIDKGGIYLNDNSTLLMDDGCYLKAINNQNTAYNIIRIYGKKNVTIKGGHLVGDRYFTATRGGEWGYGLAISGCENVYVEDLTASDCWGDGFNLQVINDTSGITLNQNIYFNRCTADNNRRQGMSVEGGKNLTFFACRFTNTKGTDPACGVDIEPYSDDNIVDNVLFERCYFKNNYSAAFKVWGNGISNVKVLNSIFTGDNTGIGKGYQHFTTGHNPKNITMESCNFDNGAARGATVSGGTDLLFLNNTITNTGFQVNDDGNENPKAGKDSILITYSIIFRGNTFISDDKFGSDLAGIGTAKACRSIIIENNIFNCVKSTSVSGFIIYLDSNSNQLKSNTFLNLKKGLSFNYGTITQISFNTFHNSVVEFLELQESAIVEENTFYGACSLNPGPNPSESVIKVIGTGNDIIIKNNTISELGIRDTNNLSKAKSVLRFSDAGSIKGLDFINNRIITPLNSTPIREIGLADAEYTSFFNTRKNLYKHADSPSFTIPTFGYLPYRVKAGDFVFLDDTQESLLIKSPFLFDNAGNKTADAVFQSLNPPKSGI